jgi:Uncharacterized protein conserved in bacteria (DUF2188)
VRNFFAILYLLDVKSVIMAKKVNYHVVPRDDGWAIKKEGSKRASDTAPTQRGAEQRAKELSSKNGGGEVVIHRPDGKIRDKDTMAPARDPMPPRDKKH